MTARNTKRVVTVVKQSDDEQDLVAALRGTGASDVRIKIFRYANYPTRPEWIDDIELEVVTSGSLEQFLKEKYGAGSYLARGFANGQWMKDGSRVIHIYGEKQTDIVPVSKNGNDSDMWKFMMTTQQQSSDRMMALMQASNNTMLQVFSAIVAGQKPLDLAGIAAMMGQLKPAGTMKETLEMVTTVVDLTNKMSGGGGEAAEPADPLQMLMGTGLRLIESRAGAAPPPPQQQPQQQQPGAPPVQNPPQQQPQQRTAEQQMLEERLRFLEQLKKKAALGKDPAEWADYIEDNQDEAVCIWLLQMVRQHPWEAIAAALAQTDPQLGQEPYQGWFKLLYDELTGQEEDTDAPRKTNTTA